MPGVIREEHELSKGGIKESLFNGKYGKPILYAVLLAMFNQLSGINAILYYAPRIFEMAGFDKADSYLQPVYIGAANLLFTIIAMTVIDRFGRKTLLLVGCVGLVAFLGLTAHAFSGGRDGKKCIVLPVGIYCFLRFFARRGVMGFYFRDLSQFSAFTGKFAGKFHSLDHGGNYFMDVSNDRGRKSEWRILLICVLCRHDGGSIRIYMEGNARNKRRSLEQIQKELGDLKCLQPCQLPLQMERGLCTAFNYTKVLKPRITELYSDFESH